MLLRHITALLPVLAAARAFKNAAPLLMLSYAPLPDLADQLEVETAENVLASLTEYYAGNGVPARNRHVLISQPGLTTNDLQSMHKFAKIVDSREATSQLRIANVLGDLDAENLVYTMETKLGPAMYFGRDLDEWSAEVHHNPTFWFNRRAKLPKTSKERKAAVAVLDTWLDGLLTSRQGRFTLVLVSTPPDVEERRYEMEDVYQGVLKQDLKRNTDAVRRASNSTRSNTSDNFQDGLPLFERYAYFSPALFMGLLVSILLITILYYAVSAIAGLEVSYMAFSKEMAPQNQKKDK